MVNYIFSIHIISKWKNIVIWSVSMFLLALMFTGLYDSFKGEITDVIGNNIDIYIFSDDLDWCKENLNFLKNKHFIEHDLADKKFYNYLYLMSKFKNFIIPNSSFAWWAAWLSQQENKTIVVPENWSGLVNQKFIDIIPSDWIKIKF